MVTCLSWNAVIKNCNDLDEDEGVSMFESRSALVIDFERWRLKSRFSKFDL